MSSYQTALQKENFIHRADEMSTDAHVCVERTDNQLVDLVLAGDAFAFEEIFDRHKRLVAIIASRYFKRPEEVEEIVQIAFAKAFTELKNFQGKYDRSLSSWLVWARWPIGPGGWCWRRLPWRSICQLCSSSVPIW